MARIASSEPMIGAAPRVALYAAARDELPTRPLFEALGDARERMLPRVRGATLEWVRVDAWSDLTPGSFGIPEPLGPSVVAPGPGDVVFLPGLAFDARGWRLGRSGGYYDRAFPPGSPGPCLVGVAYAFQQVDAVPHDSRDRRVDAIVTEAGWIWTMEAR